jgi:hypothetical protein
MRPLIRSLVRRDDAGAVLPLVAIMIVVLLGMGAIVVDFGQLYVERRELQNGADAAALAVAQDCAGGDCRDETATARTYANDNARDGKAGIGDVCGSGPGLSACATTPAGVPAKGWVKVDTVTPADDKVDYVFAPILGRETGEANATAIAAWGSVGGAATLPLILSKCEYLELGGNLSTGAYPAGRNYIYFHDTTDAGTCPAGPAGQDLPGGFGWLTTSAQCQVQITAGGKVLDKPGNSVPNNCNPASWRDATVLVPIYDRTNGLGGSNGEYWVAGFAGFHVLAYSFPSDKWENGSPCPGPKPPNSTRYICGEFTQMVTTGDIGSGSDFGAHVVQMVG